MCMLMDKHTKHINVQVNMYTKPKPIKTQNLKS